MSRLFLISLVGILSLLVGVASPHSCGELAKFGPPEFECVGSKQTAAGAYSDSAFQAWAMWETQQDDAKRDEELAMAGAKLAATFARAEAKSALMGVDCVEQTVTAADLEAGIAAAVLDVVTAIEAGLDLAGAADARCAANLLRVAGERSRKFLGAEGTHTKQAPDGGDADMRERQQEMVADKFSHQWSVANCSTAPSGRTSPVARYRSPP